MNDEQKGIIVDNFVKLAECLKCSDEFSCHFIQKRIFTANDINELLLKHGQSRSMKFLTDVQKRGPYAFDVLYDALVATCQFDLADILKPELAPSWPNARLGSVGAQVVDAGPVVGGGPGACGRCGAPQSDVRDPNSEKPDYQFTVQLDDDGDLSDSLEYLDDSNTHLDVISLPVAPCHKPQIRKLFNTKSVYKMSSPRRGRCLVINNRCFDIPLGSQQPKLDNRDGSEMDVKNIERVFKALGFHVSTHSDLTAEDMLKVIRKETALDDHAALGMFVLVIMTHGGENVLYGIDGEPIVLSQVYDTMSPYKFKQMAGKPKLVFLQACAGERKDNLGMLASGGGTCNFLTVDAVIAASYYQPPDDEDCMVEEEIYPTHMPKPGDYLSTDDIFILKASFFGFVSTLHKRQGSWFIRAVVEALYKHACHRDIQAIFQHVKEKVRKKSIAAHEQNGGTGGQQPTDHSFPTKRRKLYLFPNYNPICHD